MICCNRRSFLSHSLISSAGIGSCGLSSRMEASAPGPAKLSIAKSKSSPTDPEGITEIADRLTRKAIETLGGMSQFISKGDTVWIKPNIAWDRRPEQAATTNPDVVATLVKMCFESGAGKVLVSDNPTNVAQRTFPRSGIPQAAEKMGAKVLFLDERKFKRMAIQGKILKEWEVYTDIIEADKLINVPIAKHHGLCKVTLGMKNLMGVVGGQRNRYHQDLGNTLSDLAAFIKPELVVLDAIRVLTANGPVGGNLADVKRMDTIAASVDQVALDAFGATLLGYKPEEINHIVEAAARNLGNLNFAPGAKEILL